MNLKIREETAPEPTSRHPIAEWALLLVAAVVGVYSLGIGLGSLYGESGNLLWLAVTAAALIILSKQMGRVHDLWPHRPKHGQVAAAHATAPAGVVEGATGETRERTEP